MPTPRNPDASGAPPPFDSEATKFSAANALRLSLLANAAYLSQSDAKRVVNDLGLQTRDGVDAVNSDDTKRRTALDRMIDLREQRYHDLVDSNPKLGRFLKGWLNRSEDLRKFLDIAHV